MIEAVRRNDPVRCPVCPRTVERRSRQQVYCSPRCRKRAGRGQTTARRGQDSLCAVGANFAPGEALKARAVPPATPANPSSNPAQEPLVNSHEDRLGHHLVASPNTG
jgi:hypothetical protein